MRLIKPGERWTERSLDGVREELKVERVEGWLELAQEALKEILTKRKNEGRG